MPRVQFKIFFSCFFLFLLLKYSKGNENNTTKGFDISYFNVEVINSSYLNIKWKVNVSEIFTFDLHISMIDTANIKVTQNTSKAWKFHVTSQPYVENYATMYPIELFGATFYEVGIQTVYENHFSSKTVNLTIPPEKPFLSTTRTSYNLFNGVIPFEIDLKITTNNSYLFVTVNDLLEVITVPNQTTAFANKLLDITSSEMEEKTRWISHELVLLHGYKELPIKIGSNTSESATLIGTAFNPQLRKSECDYEFNFVIYSKYMDKEVFSNVIKETYYCDVNVFSKDNDDNFIGLIVVAVIISIILLTIVCITIRMKRQRVVAETEEAERHYIEKIIKSTLSLSPIPEESIGEEEPFFFNENTLPNRILTPEELNNFLRNYSNAEDGVDPLKSEHVAIPKLRNVKKYQGDFDNRNRYSNVQVYDFNRVRLMNLNYSNCDYINASKISGFSIGIKYIATQGPLTTTVEHFWKMVWQEKVSIIVMLTHLEENSVNKCDLYWPEKIVINFDGMSVAIENTRTTTVFTERIFKIKKKKESRKITHLHFHSWFDNSIPKIPHDFVDFLKHFRSVYNEQLYPDNPAIVHCSAGLGRTGTFILCDYLIDMARKENVINFPEALYKLRSERPHMLKDFKQYLFSHCVVNEFLNGKESSYPKYKFLSNYDNLVEKSGDDLETVASSMYWCDLLYEKLLHPHFYENIHKHRIAKPVLTYESFLYLKHYPPSDNSSSYINAIKMENFLNTTNQFICTQQPLSTTIGDFWRLIDLKNINLIISIHNIEENDTITPKFWASKLNTSIQPVDYITVETLDCIEKTGYYIISLKMENLQKNTSTIINLIQFTCWKKDILPDTPSFVSFLIEYLKHFKKSNSVLTCYDGAVGCGIFLTILGVLEKLEKDGVFDVVNVVRHLRKFRDDYMDDPKSYKFVYRVIKRALTNYSSLIFENSSKRPVYENFNLKDNNYCNLPTAKI